MSRWWRAYDGAVDDPKLCLLSDRAHRGWFNLCCVASAHDGSLPAMPVLEVKLRLPRKRIEVILTELREHGLIDEIEGVLRPHNWDRRQFKSDVTDPTNAKRQKRFRERHPVTEKTVTDTVTETVTVTPPRLQTTETDSERSEACASAPTQAELERELFRRGKQVCGKASGGLVQSLLKAKQFDVALARSVIEMAATKADPREFVAAATRVNGAPLPRPGSREDRQEKTAHAYAKLREYARSSADVEGQGFDTGDAAAGLLPFAKPS